MRMKTYSLILLALFFLSCSAKIEKANFAPVPLEKYFIHKDKNFQIKIPEDWNFVSKQDELDTVLKFSSADKTINGYIKRYPFRQKLYTLKTVVNDYFANRKQCDFETIYTGLQDQTQYYLLKGYFRDVYPIVTIAFLHGNILYELTTTYIVNKEELESGDTDKILNKLVKYSHTLFVNITFKHKSKKRLRKRYGVIMPCPDGWIFGLETEKGDISSIGYKDKIVLISLKLLREFKNIRQSGIKNEMLKIRAEFLKKMDMRKFFVVNRMEKIFAVNSHLSIVSNVPTDKPKGDGQTYSVVKKYFFIKKNRIYELLIIYSMKDITPEIQKQIKGVLSGIKFS